MTFRCPACWTEVSVGDRACPRCGEDIDPGSERARYVDKLINALRHPEPTTPIRAACVLGRIGAREALPALIDAAEHSPDLFIREAAIDALGSLGDCRAITALRALSRERSLLVRRAATRALDALEAPRPVRSR